MMHALAQATIQVIPPTDLQAKPIRIGTTTELAIFPTEANFDARDFLCRVSTATLTEGGPFTRFDGYRRILALISGAGMKLNIDGAEKTISKPFELTKFLGDVPTSSELLDGTISDFNVIYRPNVDVMLERIELGAVYSSLREKTLGAPNDSTIRVDILWSPDADLEVEAGRQRTNVEPRGVFILQHARTEATLQVRAPRGQGDALLVSLRMPK